MDTLLPPTDAIAATSRIEARFVGAAGELQRLPWLHVAQGLALEDLRPVRMFPVRRGRRVAPGWWWSATSGQLVHYGFGAMRTQVMLLDRDPDVVSMACSPVELAWLGHGGETVVHTPHLMARLRDGSGVLVDCAGRDGVSKRLGERASEVRAVVEAAGWRYRIALPPEPVVAANVRWLSGYRHPRNGGSGRMAEVAACFARPQPLEEGVSRLGDPIAVWPAVFHALWGGVLNTNLELPLHERTVASAAAERVAV
ncbi:TnsA-like heteromeric transposase endonuclease subunit [Streptomyces sp. NPDC087845]|uniref:TnsA-like heteromeric transposase endonuclease subunit n=1 Tax=Streptomyces sp. NPDC087845 TaxID=3365806 RepID=UPI0037F6CC67